MGSFRNSRLPSSREESRISRRTFLASSAAFAAELFADPPALEKLAAVALAEGKRRHASYCDIRINRYRDQDIGLHLSPERGTGKTLEVPRVSENGSFGFGVRVIVDGAWGFAASPVVTPAEITRVTGEAVTVAKANAMLKSRPVVLAPVKAYQDRWTSPCVRNPFDVPLGEKLALLGTAAREAKKAAGVFSAYASLTFHSEDKYFASSEGSSIQQLIIQTFPQLTASAVDVKKGLSRSRSYVPPPLEAGWEYMTSLDFVENALRIREEVVEHLSAPAGEPGKKDLVLLPSHLALTIHESLGHSTELDRALGYEANFAGTSFLTIDKMGKVPGGQRHRQRLRRPHHGEGAVHRRLRRRRRQDHSLHHPRERHFQALPDHSRSGLPGRRNGVARLLLCAVLGGRSVPAHAQCLPRARRKPTPRSTT